MSNGTYSQLTTSTLNPKRRDQMEIKEYDLKQESGMRVCAVEHHGHAF